MAEVGYALAAEYAQEVVSSCVLSEERERHRDVQRETKREREIQRKRARERERYIKREKERERYREREGVKF